MSKKENIKLPIIFWLSIIASTVAIVINIFRWSLFELLTPFLEPMLELAIYGFFLVIIIWSLIYGVIKVKSQKIKALIPAMINIAAVIIIVIVPFTAITLKMDFYFHLNEREDIIEKITNGELVPNVSHNNRLINLPAKYRNLSKGGGDIIVEYENENPNVFFFTFRGILDNFSGFVYRSDDNEPQKDDFGCNYIELEKLQKNWFWMSCT